MSYFVIGQGKLYIFTVYVYYVITLHKNVGVLNFDLYD